MDVALQSSVWVTSPEFAGYLQKRGFHWRKLWRQRWVALHGSEIVYMDKEPTADNATDMAITKAQITSATVIDRDDIDGHPHGFAIHVNDGQSPSWYLRAENTREKKSWLMRLDHVHAIVRWLEDFEKVRVLGVGGTGIVYEILHKTNGQRYALKEMEIKNKAQMQMALQEAEMLKDIMENIQHPNILHIDKVFQVGSKFYLVFPLCTGGELYDHVIRRGHFSEEDAAVLMKGLISGLHALHERNILHLDIKPENLLYDSDSDDAVIKITDFGLSKLFRTGDSVDYAKEPTQEELTAKMKAFAESGVLQRDKLRGTVGYMSPELILAGSCSKATDVWAAGVVLYILLCGHPPFQSKSNREILERSARGQFTMDGEDWEGISDDAKDLVRKMLIVNPKDRITTGEILNHPWIAQLDKPIASAPTTSIQDSAILQSMLGAGDRPTTPLSPVRTRTSQQNLQGAIKRLTGFVANRKTEKLVSSITRLASSLNTEDKSNRVDLLTQFLYPWKVPKKPSNSGTEEVKKDGGMFSVFSKWTGKGEPAKGAEIQAGQGQPDDDDESPLALQALLNPDTRNALAEAFVGVGSEDGKLSVEQFVALIKYFNFSSGLEGANVNDSNGGGSSGAQLGVPALLFIRFVDRDSDGLISADDIFTTHALIMQMSAIFVKAIFRLYIESIWYPGRQLNVLNLQRVVTSGKQKGTGGGIKVMEEQINVDVVEPPRFITARHISAVFEKLGFDPAGGAKLFNVLCEALSKKGLLGIGSGIGTSCTLNNALAADEDDVIPRPQGRVDSTNNGAMTNAALVAAFGSEEEEIKKLSGLTDTMSLNAIASSVVNASPGPTPVEPPRTPATPGSGGFKMDVNDFIRACEIDPVLVKIILLKPKRRINQLLKKIAEDAEKAQQAGDDNNLARRLSSRNMKEELQSILQGQRAQDTGITSSLGRYARGLISPKGSSA